MAGHHMLLASPAPSSLHRLSLSLIGQIQTQAMSRAKFVFLIALVIFFVVLFVVAYVWMRRPDFGQKGGHSLPTASRGTVGQAVQLRPSERRSDAETAPMDMDAPKVPDVP
jgi:hypothetical protein